jgi:sugar phosphate isomerase/epimerase
MAEAKIGVIHYNWPGFTFEGFLEFAAKTGYRYVELQASNIWNDQNPDAEASAKQTAKLLARHGLKVSALAANNDFILPDADAMKVQVERMKRVCGMAKIMGTNVLRTEGGWAKDSVPQPKWFDSMADCLKRCCEWADDLDVYFALDNHGTVTNDGDLQLRLFKAVGSKRVGSNLDTMNYRWFGHDIPTINRFYEILAPYVFHTHMKDGTGSREHYKGAALGEGEIDLKHAVNCLKKAGYTGAWTAEYEGPEAAGGVGYAKCFAWLKANV